MSSLGKDVDSLIISNLETESRLVVRRVCRTWKELVDQVSIQWPIPLKFSDIRPFYDIDPKLFMLLTSGHCEFTWNDNKYKRMMFATSQRFDMLTANLHLQFGDFQIKIFLQSYGKDDLIYLNGVYLPEERLELRRSEFDLRFLITFLKIARKKFIEISCGMKKIEVGTWNAVKILKADVYREYKQWKYSDHEYDPVYIKGDKDLRSWLQTRNTDAVSAAKIYAISRFLFASHPDIYATLI